MESNCAGLILHRQKPPLTQRSLVYYCSGVHTRGPSPRVRGKPAHFRAPSYAPRSIPACAGKRRLAHRIGVRSGSIPACAGETARRAPRKSGPRVHPRVCGGNRYVVGEAGPETGPSPRVRGKRRLAHRIGVRSGSIPACAGETGCAIRHASVPRSIPACAGGNVCWKPGCPTPDGPSPRVRGKQHRAAAKVTGSGSIPACAGETGKRRLTGHAKAVHPRVCGGNYFLVATSRSASGPSPRVRGKLARSAGLETKLRTGPSPRVRGKRQPVIINSHS